MRVRDGAEMRHCDECHELIRPGDPILYARGRSLAFCGRGCCSEYLEREAEETVNRRHMRDYMLAACGRD